MTENKEEVKKVSLESLIRKKLEKDNKINATKDIYVKSLDANLTVKSPSDTQRIELSDRLQSGNSLDVMEAYSRLVYDCCPILHSKDLQENIGVLYPYDTVKAIFDLDEILDIGLKIVHFFDEDKNNNAEDNKESDENEKAEEKLKN